MKILFVCRGNVGRSQIAELLFNKLSKHEASSSGIKVNEKEGQKLKELSSAKLVIDSMKEEGADVSENIRKQLKPEMLNKFDKIIVMSEPDVIPEYLFNRNNVEFWDIKDPKGMDKKEHDKIVRKIKSLVKDFINRNNL
ncbi:MAG: low molecular weight phosphatase family protein [Nanoarchaeota archaeon]